MSDATVPQNHALPRYQLFTAMRGAAALSVVFYHMCHAFRVHDDIPHPLLAFLMPVINQGWFGVDIFFLISGYGLAAKLSGGERMIGIGGTLAFARNRIWRIYPVYWACGVTAFALALVASRFNHLDWRAEFPPTPGGVLASALLIEPWTQTPPLLPIVTWTLSCELGFYAIVAAGILFRSKLSDRALLGLAIALAGAGLIAATKEGGQVFFFWPEFVCGLLVFAAVHLRTAEATRRFRVVLAALAGLGVLGAATGHTRSAVLVAIGFSFIALRPFDGALARTRLAKVLAWFGGLSFPLFLLHVPVTSRVLNLSRRFVASDSLGFIGVLLVAVAIATAAAWAVNRIIELPAQTLGRRPAPLPA